MDPFGKDKCLQCLGSNSHSVYSFRFRQRLTMHSKGCLILSVALHGDKRIKRMDNNVQNPQNSFPHNHEQSLRCGRGKHTSNFWFYNVYSLWWHGPICHHQYPSSFEFSLQRQWRHHAHSFPLLHSERDLALSIISNPCWGPLDVRPTSTQSSINSKTSHTTRKVPMWKMQCFPCGLHSHALHIFLQKVSIYSAESSVSNHPENWSLISVDVCVQSLCYGTQWHCDSMATFKHLPLQHWEPFLFREYPLLPNTNGTIAGQDPCHWDAVILQNLCKNILPWLQICKGDPVQGSCNPQVE